MKTIKTTILLGLLTIGYTTGQVDTTDWFPIQTGNYWEYVAWDIMGPKYFSQKVVGDTIMANGLTYKIISEEYFDPYSQDERYYRKDSNAVYRYVGDSIICLEYKYLDFELKDSTVWLTCLPLTENARGIVATFWDFNYYAFLQKPNEAKQFEDVAVDSVDTLWTPSDGSFPIVLNKGLGIVWHFRFNDGSYYLQGTIINGVRMGVITNVDKETNNAPISFLLCSYPNPFNPNTVIKYAVQEADLVKVKVYDILGSEVAELVNETKDTGYHSVEFNASNLPSGVYIYTLQVNGFSASQKMLLLK